jgi:probable F420-dependent oxidoreductase
VKFGIWLDFRNPPPWARPWGEIYRDGLELAELAERAGFESVWLSEHHLTSDGYLPSLMPTLATIAARTRRLRLGTAVLLAPLRHPLRLAEDAAVVDQLAQGRLELGLGLGYRRHEFDSLAIPFTDRAARTDETIEILKLAWTGNPFSFHGQHFQFDQVTVTPPPHQAPHPPISIGGSSLAAASRAGRHGCHFLPDMGTPQDVINQYRSMLTEHGHDPSHFNITVPASVHVCDDPERGWAQLAPHFLYAANLYRTWAGRPPLATPAQLDRSRYLIGPAPAIAEALQQIETNTGCDRVIFWARPPGLPMDAARRSLELFAAHFISGGDH